MKKRDHASFRGDNGIMAVSKFCIGRSAVMLCLALLLGQGPRSVAQTVGGQSAVAYANVAVPAGFSLLANPFLAEVNTVGLLLKKAPAGTVVFSLRNPASASPVGGLPPLPDGLQTTLQQQILKALPQNLSTLVSMKYDSSGIKLTWSGALLSATSIEGPYALSDLSGGNALLPSSALGGPVRFWRAEVAAPIGLDSLTGNVFQDGVWTNPDQSFLPGEGLLIYAPSGFTNTFSGGLATGTITNLVSTGWTIRSCMVPYGNAGLTTKMGFKPQGGEHVVLLKNGALEHYFYNPSSGWLPSEPIFHVGQSGLFYVSKEVPWVTTLTL